MADNFRIHYPIQEVRLGPYCAAATGSMAIHGLQSVSANTSFNLESVFELGQLDIYENIEGLPQIEFTMEKVLDGYPLMYHLATSGAATASLLNRSNQRADLYLNIYPDTFESASGVPMLQVYCSGMYINSVTYNLSVEGNSRESISLVGNDKIWSTGSLTGTFDNDDSPAFVSGVLRRQDVVMGDTAGTSSRWPTIIPGIEAVSGHNALDGDKYTVHIQDVSITANFGREDINELGHRRPYYRYATFPIQVETSINVLLAPQDGASTGDGANAVADSEHNVTDETIVVHLADGTVFDMGTKNKLASVSYGGGDANGGNVTATYVFRNFNTLTVTHPEDPDSDLDI